MDSIAEEWLNDSLQSVVRLCEHCGGSRVPLFWLVVRSSNQTSDETLTDRHSVRFGCNGPVAARMFTFGGLSNGNNQRPSKMFGSNRLTIIIGNLAMTRCINEPAITQLTLIKTSK